LYNAVVTVNGVTLTDRARKISWKGTTNKQPAAAMGEVQDYSMPGTLVIGTISIEYYQDYAATNVYITHKDLWAARSSFVLTAKADSAADSATNPNFTCSVFIAGNPFLDGARGDVHLTTIEYEPAAAMTFDVT
jgi:hypothetical protein